MPGGGGGDGGGGGAGTGVWTFAGAEPAVPWSAWLIPRSP